MVDMTTHNIRTPKTFAEFFAGIGLVHLGLQPGGWTCVYANDIEPKKQRMYADHFGAAPYYHIEDVWRTDAVLDRINASPFLATASFPCIDLSLAGHWRGFDGKHSSTYFGFLEVLGGLVPRPPLVMLENVCGFLTSRGGEDFGIAMRRLAELGYWIDAIVLDARWFVPQSRPRLFVFGFHESLESSRLIRRPCGFHLDASWNRVVERSAVLRPPLLRALMDRLDLPTGWATGDLPPPQQVQHCLADVIDFDPHQEWWTDEQVRRHYAMMEPPSRRRVDELLHQGAAAAVGAAFRRTRRGATRCEVRFDLAGCLRTPKGGSAKQIVVAIAEGTLRMRWMSAREYARLQGADDFQICVPPLQAMFGFGDAVCVPAVRWIDDHILTPAFECSQSTPRRQVSAAGT